MLRAKPQNFMSAVASAADFDLGLTFKITVLEKHRALWNVWDPDEQ